MTVVYRFPHSITIIPARAFSILEMVETMDQNVLLPYGDRSRFGFQEEGRKFKTNPVE
jgi:hypothetical protein